MIKEKYIAAVAQLDTTDDYEHNLKCAAEFIEEAHSRSAKLISFPENWTYQGDDYADYAEKMPGGRLASMMSAYAEKYGMWIHSGSSSEINSDPDDSRPYNTSMVFDPQGKLIAKYSKIHCFDVNVDGAGVFRESDHKKPGDKIVTCETNDIGKLGLSICYDIRFPEQYRLMAMDGAEVMFAPSSFVLMTGKDHWEILLRARAVENSCYMLAGAQCGVKYDGPTYGRSLIVDPWGIVVAEASDYPCVITAEIEPDFRKRVKSQLLSLENRRDDVYTLALNNS